MFLSPASNAQIPWMLPQFRRGTQGSGPPPVWDPTLYGTVFGFWEADTLGLTDGASVSTWTAILGSNMTSGGADPIFKTGIINGKPVVRFSSSVLNFPDMSALTALSAFVVFADNGNYGLWNTASGADDNGQYYDLGSTIFDAMGSTVRKSFATGGTAATPHLFEIIAGGANWDAYRNGSSLFSTGSNTFHAPSTSGMLGVNSAGFHINADIAAVLIYSNTLNSTNRGNVETHFISKYAL